MFGEYSDRIVYLLNSDRTVCLVNILTGLCV